MKRIFILMLLLVVYCLPQCKMQKSVVKELPKKVPTVQATGVIIIPIKKDSIRVITKYVEVPKYIFPDKVYTHLDSLLTTRMNTYSDSNKIFIAAQSLLLKDYKNALIKNIKLTDSIIKVRKEKKVLAISNKSKEKIINSISRVDYYIATTAWTIMTIMIILVLIKQHKMKQEIIAELRTNY